MYQKVNLYVATKMIVKKQVQSTENMKENFSSKTIILIAHRKTTIDACDKIINLKNGYIN